MKYHVQEFESNREESAHTQMINWLNTQAIDPRSIVHIQYFKSDKDYPSPVIFVILVN